MIAIEEYIVELGREGSGIRDRKGAAEINELLFLVESNVKQIYDIIFNVL